MAVNYLGPVPPVRRDPLTLEQFYKQPYFKEGDGVVTVDTETYQLSRHGVTVQIDVFEHLGDIEKNAESPKSRGQGYCFINNVAVPGNPTGEYPPPTYMWMHLDFSQALELLKAGYKLTRQAFEDKEFNHVHHIYYIALQTLDSPNPDHFQLRVAVPDEGNMLGYFEPGIGWTPDHGDMFAKDWMVVRA